MEKLKIIHILYAGLGGHGNVVFPLLESEFGNKHDNTLVFFGVEDVLPSYLAECKRLNITNYAIKKKPRKYRKAFLEFKNILNTEKPDRIIVHSSELIITAVNYGKKRQQCSVFYVEHENNATKGASLKLLSIYALRKANVVVCLSETYQKELCEQFKCKVSTVIIPNGINTKKFAPVSDKPNEPFVLGMASRMIPGKDHITLFNAFKIVLASHPKVELHIAGNGETLEAVKKLAMDLGINENVKFLGLLSEKEMVHFYETISVYILATKSETLSTAILQAMSCELPVITSDIKNNAILLEHNKTGWFYKDGNSLDLSVQMNYVISNFNEAKSIGKAARKHVVNEYSNDQMFRKYDQLMTEI